MIEDTDLLRRFAEEGSEEAFSALVRRRIGLVYSIALRHTRDANQAEEAAQAVFVGLARKASTLTHHPALIGWLYRSARFAAVDSVRSALRRKANEERAQNMQLLDLDSREPDWKSLQPVIDDVLCDLGSRDRDALLLRFIDQRPFAEIGKKLRLSENAARMRVERALERVRLRLASRGLKSTAAVLALALEGQAAVTAPPGLVATVTGSATAGATLAGGAGLGVLTFMSATKITAILVGTAALAAIGFGIYERQRLSESQSTLVSVERQRDELGVKLKALAGQSAHPPWPGGSGGGVPSHPQVAAQVSTGTIKPTAESGMAGGMIPVRDLKESGNRTPTAAVESLLWARETGNIAAMGKIIAVSQADSQKVAAVFASLSAADRENYGITSPEEMIAFVFSGGGGKYAAIQQLTPAQQDTDDVTVPVVFQQLNGAVNTNEFALRRTGEGWQWIVPTDLVAAVLKQISGSASTPSGQ